MRISLSLSLLAVAALCRARVSYDREIEPLLRTRCHSCHGAKLQLRKLRLDRRADALKGGESGVPAVVPGDSRASLLLRYVSGEMKDTIMPPAGDRLKPAEVDLLTRWIDEGAPWSSEAAAVVEPPDPRRNHWAFQPVRKPVVPAVRRKDWVRNPIDAFVLAKLEAKGWEPSPAASPRQLARRAFLDLTGLPPDLDEQRRFGQDARPEALDALIEELLARPAYGERWARHWLDLVRYAESNGYERDAAKPNAWKYRDYVIRAFNSDKPYDRFIAEQLAGDEFPSPAEETLIATGFNRLGPWDDEPADPAEDRFDQLDDLVSTTSQAFLGLTLGCARCHNHKFDPLTARDYYSMVAIFNGLERPRRGRTELDLPVGAPDQIAAEDRRTAEILLASSLGLAQFGVAGFTAPAVPARIEAIRKAAPDLPRGYFLNEPKPPSPMHLLIRGKVSNPGPLTPPAVPAVLVREQPEFPPPGRTSFRRMTLARWLVHPENPLTARVMVNRVWKQHFGEGLVRTPSDFGLQGQRPSHPELLDWLAAWFVENGWSIKKLHRLMLESNTWRMSKVSRAGYAAEDPENLLLWRSHYRRLEVEAIRDSMLAVSGKLNRTMYGPSFYPEIPDAALSGSSDPDKIWKNSPEPDRYRRTVYAFLKRSMIVPMLEVLDLCDTTRSSAVRPSTSVAPQALTLFNGEFVNAQARFFAARLRAEAGSDPKRQVEHAYRLAVARPPTARETETMTAFLERESLEQLARVILNLNEFVYPD